MHITKLEAENVKRIKAVRITPDGNLVVISGRNGQGKTSVLDSIWLAVQGSAAGKESPDPLRHGEVEGFARVHLGDLVVTRTWKRGKTSKLEVKEGGVKQRSPQKLLDALVGKLSFDPLAFAYMKESAQKAALLDLVELPFDPDELEQRRQVAYDGRTQASRDVKKLEGQFAGLPAPPTGTPAEEVSVAELLAEHADAQEEIRKAQVFRDAVTSGERFVSEAKEKVAAAKAELERCSRMLEEASLAAKGIPETLPDPDTFLERINSAEQVNANVRAGAKRAQVRAELDEAIDHVAQLTESIKAIDKEKARGLREAKMPVKGLGFTADGVTYGGVPLSQACASERLRVSTAMAMAMSPELRVIRITDGSLLDSDGMALLETMAREHDFQVWVERVSDEGGAGVVIEDGEVASVSSQPGPMEVSEADCPW